MRTRDPFGQALCVLRRTLRDGGLAPGQHLPINDIALALGLSASPVREALSRLCGEGLIEDRRGLGYFTRILPTEDIVGLLELEQAHVELALRLSPLEFKAGEEPGDMVGWIRAVVEECGSVPLKESFDRVARRLETPRSAPAGRLRGQGEENGDPLLRMREAYRVWTENARVMADQLRRMPPATLRIDKQ